MRKILVLHRYPPAQVIGTNASFIEFLRELLKNNFDVHYLTFKETVHKEKIKGLKYVFLPFTFNRGKNFDKLIKTYLWIILTPVYAFFLNKKDSFDIVYCDDSIPYYGFFIKILIPNSKVIIRLGDLQSGYNFADNHPYLFKLFLKLETLMWSRLDGLIAISEEFKNFLIKQKINKNKIRVVEESINTDITGKFNKVVKNSGVILFHGTIVRCKGLRTVIDAFSIFNKKNPNTRLVIAGGGPEEKKLKTYVKSKNIKNVEFYGWYDHKCLKDIMQNVQIGIASRSANIANNFVVTTCLLENWAYSKPVIAPKLKSFSNIIKEGENGFLFKPDNEKDLAKKLEYVFNNPKLYKKLGKNGYNTAKNIFYYKKIAQKMTKILMEFLNEI